MERIMLAVGWITIFYPRQENPGEDKLFPLHSNSIGIVKNFDNMCNNYVFEI